MKKIQYCAILSGRKNIAQIAKTLYRPFAAQVYSPTYANCFQVLFRRGLRDNKYN